MSAGHEHSFAQTNSTRLKWALLLTGSFLVAEVVGGILTGSLALISDAAHMLTDAVALAIALAAINIARRPTNDRLTYGYHRFEILAAAFNAFLLFGVAFYILYAAYERLNQPAEIQSVGMLVIAVLGLLVNLASMRLLAPAQGNSLNVKGAYLEVWSDMLGSLGVIVAAIVIRFTGWVWVDSLVAVLIGFWVLPRAWILLRESLHVLLDGVPKEIQLAELREALLGIPGVTGLHDLHVWSITSGKVSLTSHLVYDPALVDAEALLGTVKALLHDRYEIEHSTLQLETSACAQAEEPLAY